MEFERQLQSASRLLQSGELNRAELQYQEILQQKPDYGYAHFCLGFICQKRGDFSEAIEYYQRAIYHQSDYIEALNNLGNLYKDQGSLSHAIQCYQKIIELQPNQPYGYYSLGLAHESQENIGEALAFYKISVELAENFANAHHKIGKIYLQQGNLAEASQSYQKVIQNQPNHAKAFFELGFVYQEQAQFSEAIASYQQAIQLEPGLAEGYNNLGNVLKKQGKLSEAIAAYQQALQLKPALAEIHNNLGNIFREQGKSAQAIAAYQRALQLKPNLAEIHNNLGNAFKDQGKSTQAIAAYQQALQLKPDYAVAHHNLLLSLNYSDAYEPSVVYGEHEQWGDYELAALPEITQQYANVRDINRRLRVGYVSGDCKTHSVTYFLEPLLAAHDHQNFEIIGYANNRKVDAATQRLQQQANSWRDISSLSDEQAVSLIRQDQVDILVDLSGHTKGNRLRVFAYKPAPIQISYIGYPNTTGLNTIDYRFTDSWADPEGKTEHLHTERLVHLPAGFLCFQPPLEAPAVNLSPCLSTGHITFGSFNNLAKTSPQLIDHWSRILSALPQARLIIKAKSLADRDTWDAVSGLFRQNGIEPDRVELLSLIPSRQAHLALYNRIDIALDTFPYSGTATTCEAMWMGVPVITLAGQTHAARVGVSLLSAVGLPELIADSTEDYLQKAIDLASDRERLQMLRGNLRDRMKAAPLTNARLITQSVETAYRTLWHDFCKQYTLESNHPVIQHQESKRTQPEQALKKIENGLAKHPSQTLDSPKFILIKAWGYGFWSDVDHVLGQLLAAELTGRIPIVHWGDNSLYQENQGENAFETYFEPISAYTIDHLLGHDYRFYPPKWTEDNLKTNDLNKWEGPGSKLSGSAFLSRQEDVIVSDFHSYVYDLMTYIDRHHPLADKSPQEIYRYLFKKYLKIRPDISRDIEHFWSENLADHPTLAVHVRGSDKAEEVSKLAQTNQKYHQLIRNYLIRVPDTLIFLLTDETSVLEDYQSIYGNKIRFTTAFRTKGKVGIHYTKQYSRKQLGIEIIKDTYLAAKCDYFIGNGWSNVSTTVLHLRDWQEDHYVLLLKNVLFDRQSKASVKSDPFSKRIHVLGKQGQAQNVTVTVGRQIDQIESEQLKSESPDLKIKRLPNLDRKFKHSEAPSAQPTPSNPSRKLHIGGKVSLPGWEVLNAVPASYVDHIGNANDLSRFPDNTFTDIYASHLVEHLDYKNELVTTLKEWHRALVPGGKVYISVPDLDVLAKLFIDKDKLTFSERFMVMRMMFGGHVDQYDYHVVGLNQEFLTMYLKQAGYTNVRRVEKFGLFNDTSNYLFKNTLISVNLIAEKPIQASLSTLEQHSQPALNPKPASINADNETANSTVKHPDDVAVEATTTVDELLKTANALGAQGKFQAATEHYQRVLSLAPQSFAAIVNLGNMLKAQGRYRSALDYYRQALEIHPNNPAAENNLACVLKDQGLVSEAIEHFHKAIDADASFTMADSNLLLTLNYSSEQEPSVIWDEHRRWATLRAAPLAQESHPYSNEPNPERRLRIGYVSSDFCTHSVAYFFEPLLTAHNRCEFEVVCYANGTKADATTARLRTLADDWRHIHSLNDEQVADRVRQDSIDLLVDLSGHTNGHRLFVFAHKPAPIQVSYLGYPNTTGLETIDYRVTDDWADPQGQNESFHSEQLVRLPHGFLCYLPPSDCPAVSSLPSLTTGRTTFGSFNNLAKVSPQLIGYWSSILLAVPHSRIILKSRPLADSHTRDYVYGLFQQKGVDNDRVTLQGLIPSRREHFALYHQVDIALDTFPYNGTTTTCEAMWMGVPVVTLVGQTHASRVGCSLLSSVGLPDLIANSPEDYIQTAIALASDRHRLQVLRGSLRDRMGQAPLTNGALITQSLEDAYRRMWRNWCQQVPNPHF